MTFLSSSLLPHQFAFALFKDCGPHDFQLCGEHENSHLVMTHEDGTARSASSFLELNGTDSSHDSSHQIDEKPPYNAIMAKQLTEYNASFIAVVVTNDFLLPPRNGYKHQYFSLDPPGKNHTLSCLKTTRLLI